MDKDVSAKLLFNLIKEKYDKFKSLYTSMLSALSENNQAQKFQSVKNVADAAKALSDILAEQDKPAWLKQIVSSTSYISVKIKLLIA